MAYLYASSKTWRSIVDATRSSSGYMLAFAGACVALPYFLGDQVMQQTNAAASRQESELERKLRSGAGLDAQMLARAQRERLQVLLNESKSSNSGSGGGEARYRAALDGQSLGTHSSGSTAGAVAIRAVPPAPTDKESQKGRAR